MLRQAEAGTSIGEVRRKTGISEQTFYRWKNFGGMGVAVTNPYHAMTDAQGHFTIPDVPEGVYTLIAWHPGMGGILDMKVVVLSNETLQVRFEFENAPDRRMAHTKMVERPHFGIGTLDTFGERIDIQPTHQIQSP